MKKVCVVLIALMAVLMVKADGIYLVGSFSGWKPQPQFKMATNEAAEAGIKEYMITVDLKVDDAFKAAYSANDATIDDKDWYPTGMGNDYKITKDGKYTIYCRPEANGGEGWYENTLYVVEEGETGIDAVVGVNAKSVKIMENGQVYILRNGVRYNANGAAVK